MFGGLSQWDYIRRAAGKPFLKSWKDGLDRLAAPTLFDPVGAEPARTVVAHLMSGHSPGAGQELVVEVRGSVLVLLEGLSPIATVEEPPSELFAAICGAAGVATARVERVGVLADIVEVSIR